MEILYVLIGVALLAAVAWAGQKAGERDVKRIRAEVYGVGKPPAPKRRKLPLGYELNTFSSLGRCQKIVPTFCGIPITEGYFIRSTGYQRAIRRARKDIFIHFDNNVDIKNV